jgi:hypothetical protein
MDKYYTTLKTSKFCVKKTLEILRSLNINYEKVEFIEPSAGDGSFLKALEIHKIKNIKAYDIEPAADNIIKKDFFEVIVKHNKNRVVLGNPPFGFKAKLAIDFLNHASDCADIIAFIVPIQFRKFSVHQKLNINLKLIYDKLLPDYSFEYNKRPYNIRCVFQIWVKNKPKDFKDLRLYKNPQTKHEDFEMFQYNNTEGALKYFTYAVDFAVPRQGFYDYTIRIFNPKDCDKKIQWILFKAKNEKILKRLLKLDFVKLSHRNTTIPGFGKADVVSLYNSIYGHEKCVKS